MIPMGRWNDFKRYLELLPWTHETISMVTRNYFLGSMETFSGMKGTTLLNYKLLENGFSLMGFLVLLAGYQCGTLKVKGSSLH
jgi:hypothetical protein